MTETLAFLRTRNSLPVFSWRLDSEVNWAFGGAAPDKSKGQLNISALLCALNSNICAGPHGAVLPSGSGTIQFPALAEEAYMEAVQAKVPEGSSVSDVVNAISLSPEFEGWKNPDRVLRMNRYGPGTRKLFEQKGGTVWVPSERYRYLTALPPEEARLLSATAATWKLGLDADSLEEVPSRLEQGAASGPSDLARAALQYAALLSTIKYPAQLKAPVHIGVADKIDTSHPGLANAVEPLNPDDQLDPASSPDGKTPEFRALRDEDHGTAIASLIAARWSPFSDGSSLGLGLAPQSVIVPLHSEEVQLSNEIDLSRASSVYLFNLSLSFGQYSQRFANAILRRRDRLFVAAAGKEGQAIGYGGIVRYPAMFGNQENVIVVAATTADGTARLADPAGGFATNFGREFVSIAAPGEGFIGAGNGFAYVPTFGSSFAAPLVTSAAALLFTAGVTDPWKVKERIISTGDFVADLEPYVLGGRLNVGRALAHLGEDVLVEAGNPTPKFVNVVGARKISLPFASGMREVFLADVRRLTRIRPNTYRVLVHVENQAVPAPGGPSPTQEIVRIDDFIPPVGMTIKYRVNGGPQTSIDIANIADLVGKCP